MRHVVNALVVSLIGLSYACAPVFSDFTDARTEGKGKVELGASYSQTALFADTLNRFATPADFWEGISDESFDDQAIALQHTTTLYATYGLLDAVDLRGFAGFITTNSLFFSPDGNDDALKPDDVFFFAVGPKIEVIQQHVAFYFPFGSMFYLNTNKKRSIDSNFDGTTIHFHPTMLISYDIHPYARLTQSAKILFNFADDADVLLAANTGLALGNQGFRIRPEIGFMTQPGEQDWFMHYGIGFTLGF